MKYLREIIAELPLRQLLSDPESELISVCFGVFNCLICTGSDEIL